MVGLPDAWTRWLADGTVAYLALADPALADPVLADPALADLGGAATGSQTSTLSLSA